MAKTIQDDATKAAAALGVGIWGWIVEHMAVFATPIGVFRIDVRWAAPKMWINR